MIDKVLVIINKQTLIYFNPSIVYRKYSSCFEILLERAAAEYEKAPKRLRTNRHRCFIDRN